MNRVFAVSFAGIALAVSAFSSAQAGAILSNVNGSVLVNTGTGYRAPAGTKLRIGDRIMIGSKASATIKFDDGCSVPLTSGILTIGGKSPCAVQAQGVEVPASVQNAANGAANAAASSGLSGQAAAKAIAQAAARAASAAGLTGEAAASAVATATASAAASAGIPGVTAATAAAAAASATGVGAGTTVAVGSGAGGLLGSFTVTQAALAGGAVLAIVGTIAVIANNDDDNKSP